MISLLSPAKNLDFTKRNDLQLTKPVFPEESQVLMNVLKKRSVSQLAKLMDLSRNLAELNHARYQLWNPEYLNVDQKAALFAFSGDVYRGMNARAFRAADIAFAQDHLVILSGLHGILRPLDAIQPYRLEMGTSLRVNAKYKDLYNFWGSKISTYLDTQLKTHKDKIIVNLASSEYFKVVERGNPASDILHCAFMDWKNGRYQVVMTWAKLARGMMAREIISKKLLTPDDLKKAKFGGYIFNRTLSKADNFVFTRKQS